MITILLNESLAYKAGAYCLAFLLATWPSNWFIRKLLSGKKPDTEETRDKMGALIGTLERLLAMLLIGVDAYSAVGFVVAMKSIARYDRMQKEKAFAEYFLAGTMLSIMIALLLTIILQKTVGKI
jgi:hypothetical protein